LVYQFSVWRFLLCGEGAGHVLIQKNIKGTCLVTQTFLFKEK